MVQVEVLNLSLAIQILPSYNAVEIMESLLREFFLVEEVYCFLDEGLILCLFVGGAFCQ